MRRASGSPYPSSEKDVAFTATTTLGGAICELFTSKRYATLEALEFSAVLVEREKADAILANGYIAARDGSGVDISDCGPARLFKRMQRCGVSKFHPDPITALREALEG